MMFLLGFLTCLACSIGFLLFVLWHNKRYPLIQPDEADTELASTRIYSPPSYGLDHVVTFSNRLDR